MKHKLSDLFELQMGKTPSRDNLEYWSQPGFPWISIADMSNAGKYIYNTKESLSRLAVEESGIKIIPARTVIMSFKLSIGKVSITPVPMYSNEAIMAFIDKGIVKIKPEYLYYLLLQRNWDEGTNKAVMGKTLNKATLSDVIIDIHPIEEQEKIVDVLDKVSKMIDNYQRQLRTLDTLIKARFVEMFGDMLINPMNWPEQRLETVAEIVSGITKGRKIQTIELFEVPYMAVSNVKDGYIDWTTVKTIAASQAEIDHYRLMPDDVLMTEGGDPDKLGRGAIIHNPPKDCIHQNHIFRVRLNQEHIRPEFMEQYLQHQRAKRYFLGCAKQTTGIASINMTQLRALPMLMPPMGLQNQFATFVSQVDKSKVVIQAALDKAQTLFDSLMQQYFG